MKIIRFKNREALVRGKKNKGAVSAEYILVAVCVALLAMWGLRAFGGMLTNKLNATATTVGAVTNDPNQQNQEITTSKVQLQQQGQGGAP